MFEVAVQSAPPADAFAAVCNSPLFSLPRELRDEIYGYCVTRGWFRTIVLNLRATCRIVSYEMGPMFWDSFKVVQQAEDCIYEYQLDELCPPYSWPAHDFYPHVRNVKIMLTDTKNYSNRDSWYPAQNIELHYDLRDEENALRAFQGVGLQRGLCEIETMSQNPRKILAPNLVRSLQRLTDFATVTVSGSARCEEYEQWDELPLEEMAISYQTLLEPTLGPFVRDKWWDGGYGECWYHGDFSYTFRPRAHWERVEAEVTEMMRRMFSEPGKVEDVNSEQSA